MQYCLLGGGNWLASWTAEHLLKLGHEVWGIGRNPPKEACFRRGFEYEYHAYHLNWEQEFALELMMRKRPQVVINFAAQGESVASFEDYRWRFYDTNVTALIKLATEIGKRNYLHRWVQMSTPEVFGNVKDLITEDLPFNPSNPYGASKAAFDFHMRIVARTEGFSYNAIRPANLYGPGQQLYKLLPRCCLAAAKKESFPLYGGGVVERGFIHAEDLANALRLISEGPVDEEYVMGANIVYPIKKVVEMVYGEFGLKAQYFVEDKPNPVGRKAEDEAYNLSHDKLAGLGWRQQIGLTEGIKDMKAWIDRYPEVLTKPTEFVFRA